MVNKENIRAFVTTHGTIIGEVTEDTLDPSYIKLNHPFRLVPTEDGKVGVAAIFVKEDWCIVSKSNVIEINVGEGLQMLYCNYESQIYQTIILPPEKQIIL